MRDLAEILATARQGAATAEYSLTYRLEQEVGGYFVQGEGVGAPLPWLTVYFDARFEYNDYNSMIELAPENVVAFVSLDLCLAFVRADHLTRFARDAQGYGLVCVATTDFAAEEFRCAGPDAPLKGVRWGTDGKGLLNPARFSVRALVEQMNNPAAL